MQVSRQTASGNSAKFQVVTKRGTFVIALSHTLRTNTWALADESTEQSAAEELAEAIVSRHDPKLPFRKVYVFGDHNSEPQLQQTVKYIRMYGYERMVNEKA